MDVVAVRAVSNTHCEHIFKHRVRKKLVRIAVVALTPERANEKAWKAVKELYKKKK